MDARAFLDELRRQTWYRGQLVHVESVPPREATHGELDDPLHPSLEQTLRDRGLLPLYRHQAEAINALLRGEHVAVATPAASGKSLCYHVPILQAMLEEKSSRALLLYPTKALAQDQLRTLDSLVPHKAQIRTAIYDGDTPPGDRGGIRRSARVLLTNPDMLHVGILPNHRGWAQTLSGLRYVVLDEAHVYRGVFGSHVAGLIRRLRRLCARYGASPQFILCSATIANPGELARRLVGLPFREVTSDGSPSGGKSFAFWNPPFLDEESDRAVGSGSADRSPPAETPAPREPDSGLPAGESARPRRTSRTGPPDRRKSPTGEVSRLMSGLVQAEVRTMAFVRTRRMAELVYRSVRDLLRQESVALSQRVAPYRGTYLPEDRRRVEEDLRSGRLLGVVTTNALELGIDVGDLDASLLTGYPGSVASTWQQAGRSGRRGEASLAMLVARDNPLDQYLMRHPDFFFGRPHEEARIAPENPYILAPHLLCAAYESPLTPGDEALFGPSFGQRVAGLVEAGLLRQGKGRWFLDTSVDYPAQEVNLRATSGSGYALVEASTGRVLEAGIEESAAFAQLHPGAVYLHQGEPYMVTELDQATHTALVATTDANYYTQARELTDIRILNTYKERQGPGGSRVFFGEVEVTSQVVAFKKLLSSTDRNLGEELLDLPPHRFASMALWFELPEQTLERILEQRRDLAGGLHAMEHAAIGVLPLFALCDRNDIGGVSTPLHPDTGRPAVFIYDGYPGGIGIAERGFEIVEELWEATLHTVAECPCRTGCPGCIQSPKCGNNNQPLDKAVAASMLRALLGRRE